MGSNINEIPKRRILARVRVVWATRRGSTNRKQFWLLGAPEDGAEEKRDHVPILRRFGKKMQNKKIAYHDNFHWKFKNRGSDRSSAAIAEPNGDKKLSYRRGIARCVVSVETLPIAMQQCRNYLYDKSWTKYQLSLIDTCVKIVLYTALDDLCDKL